MTGYVTNHIIIKFMTLQAIDFLIQELFIYFVNLDYTCKFLIINELFQKFIAKIE